MAGLKFTRRETELSDAKKALEQSNFVTYYCFNNSGLSHYLKKLCEDLNTDQKVCFYIDCEKQESVATQIAEQIVAGCEQKKLRKYIINGGEVLTHVVKSLASSVDVSSSFFSVASIGAIAINLIDAIKETVDVDIDHVSDYKIEKAIIKMLKKINEGIRIKCVYILLDNASVLSPTSLEFVAKLFSINNIKVMLTFPRIPYKSGIEILSKLSTENYCPYTIDNTFQRPDNHLISGLFQCYNKPIRDEYYNIFEHYERNIHVIMSFIHGFNMDFLQLDKESLCILKIMIIFDTYLNIHILYNVFIKGMHLPITFLYNDFEIIIKKLEKLDFVKIDSKQNVHLNKKLVTEHEVGITLIEKLTISRNIIECFEIHKIEMTIPQLKFIIHNLDKDYNRRKKYILLLLNKQYNQGIVEQQYLDMLFSLDKKTELVQVCSMYYDMQVYDVPYIRIKQHSTFLYERECQILLALLQERLHLNDYCQKLWDLIYSSRNIDEKCLIMAVLFTALYNNGENQQCTDILYNTEYEYYYKNFQQSKFFHFLLRNTSYYIEDIKTGISNYNYCLSKFKNSDLVNYNRTLSNFVGYLIKYNNDSYAKIILKEKIKEVQSVLEYNDTRYLYLNINYGIYLMRELDEDPTKYFDAFLYDSGTTETPYIYAKINQALYVAKENPSKALVLLDEIFYDSINESNVVPTKILYKINRILVEYMNGICNEELLDEIKSEPLRGDEKDAQAIYSFYSYRFSNNIKFKSEDWKNQFHPGCIFYHGFDAELILSTFEKPSCNI